MIALAICVYMIGLLILYTWGQLSDGWYEYYYLWDKCKDLLLVSALYYCAGRLRWAVLPVVLFSIIRLLWQIVSTITGLDINNTKAVGILFIAMAFTCSFLTIKELLKWHKSNGR